MTIRRLTPHDAASFQELRLLALKEEPSAFGSSYEEEVDFSASKIESRLAFKADQGPFGAFEDGRLIGLVALGREGMKKLSHKAMIWGMYVAPEFRGRGIARGLLIEALTFARSIPGIIQVNLGVNATNANAIQLYQSVGFKVFGHELNALQIDGELYDEIHMYLRFTDA